MHRAYMANGDISLRRLVWIGPATIAAAAKQVEETPVFPE